MEWIPGYGRQSFSSDLIAGLIVAILLIPQGMAYAALAGLPPSAGLYASMLPLLVYPLLGSSRYLSVAPVAMDSLLVANAIQQIAPDGDLSVRIQIAIVLAALVGILVCACPMQDTSMSLFSVLGAGWPRRTAGLSCSAS